MSALLTVTLKINHHFVPGFQCTVCCIQCVKEVLHLSYISIVWSNIFIQFIDCFLLLIVFQQLAGEESPGRNSNRRGDSTRQGRRRLRQGVLLQALSFEPEQPVQRAAQLRRIWHGLLASHFSPCWFRLIRFSVTSLLPCHEWECGYTCGIWSMAECTSRVHGTSLLLKMWVWQTCVPVIRTPFRRDWCYFASEPNHCYHVDLISSFSSNFLIRPHNCLLGRVVQPAVLLFFMAPM